ncbi:hypothetical protein MIMGU_mgv1a007419mg [Erythranthe guttata]|uniref:BZIP domain-containing protein n=1 Tax=Erythranthe guttata TaxID=4155 RepID=A0A022RBK5_ERYGU|nr:PREDICTED: ABSCISIC ACID-INSENSITIVE 5-like protein 5 [Erythranthe guttata]XP_012838721.1 PREDICTED: ABSCISIC ACID-INSENSITIVE 5-like protein 5 [Erythranthe guttata]XP_012838722.1 PREDICTED: ABSCISIC ACID-INSENSITIVE 5-like protein 5 [Erythranthe guttata]EYU36305.1 hypothetical protein MIMGU_mgv1a007419mg [Erythranthe guttata]|eukprot:XP_012838720.1 PREDICTED: ABSCISIC ACID-INSENSITIVE 5-like protein 5 [Erythranthe guttata]
MGGDFNFNNFGTDPPGGNYPLTRQHSVYSLTFDEFQSTVAGTTKDFGSMNMDELLRSIWSAEENQIFGSTSGVGGGGGGGGVGGDGGNGYLLRQGSLTLPRTLSQKTVDEVWRDMAKDYNNSNSNAGKDSVAGGTTGGSFGVPQGQPTLGEITLEEFLFRAGVVKEDNTQFASAKPSNNSNNNNSSSVSLGFFSELSRPVTNPGLDFGISNQIAMQSANLPLNVNGGRSSTSHHTVNKQQLLPKQAATLAYNTAPPMGIPQLSTSMVQSGGVGIVSLGGNNTVMTGSPSLSSDGPTKSNTSSVSPVPYVFNGGLRGRKTAVLEKVVERRQRRMIKNRESAARSRARKQAYTMELEAEIAKPQAENEELQKRQAELMQMQTGNGDDDSTKQQNESKKKQCLRRTQTGPW